MIMIIDQDTRLQRGSLNSLWREPNLESFTGEIVLTGERIKAACGLDKAILAWDSKLRHAGKRNGYHGGCAPAEALVPFSIYGYGPQSAAIGIFAKKSSRIGGRSRGMLSDRIQSLAGAADPSQTKGIL
ncbi:MULTISPECIES: hypothetical protein [Thiorhodovibrio]|uniref:hypothetical protein n=1 Tax=Thiorhodovibrio TaxID=61593 RepID=UPI0019129BF9|nr:MULTISPECIES: hypothetical protein [Thiorhodovibrio]MBK5971106.1 hypothetical protein [Thiorhodovibrio winogradskyi]WPL10526.1 hypothetical protein Thiosp_00241 [Thiorhodovibrio litoralis]